MARLPVIPLPCLTCSRARPIFEAGGAARLVERQSREVSGVRAKIATGLSISMVLLAALLLIALASILFVALGTLGTLIFPLSLFESTLIALGAAGVLSLCLCLLVVLDNVRKLQVWMRQSQEQHACPAESRPEEEPAEEQAVAQADVPIVVGPFHLASGAIDPDQPCPCGSGKKFINCCAN
jgi:hypothetical protein